MTLIATSPFSLSLSPAKRFLVNNFYMPLTERRMRRFIHSFPETPSAHLLMLGVGNGRLTNCVAKRVGTKRVSGIEIDLTHLSAEIKDSIEIIKSDLNESFPIESNSVDVIGSDQVIEHLYNVDSFAEEVFRVLKPGGRAIICTENLSAWHNVGALFLGYQAFAQTISRKRPLGKLYSASNVGQGIGEYWNHIHIFTLRGLKDLFRHVGFEVVNSWGVGYFPLPVAISTPFEVLDPTHSYFIGVELRKPNS